jgi:hypothetical protein
VGQLKTVAKRVLLKGFYGDTGRKGVAGGGRVD